MRRSLRARWFRSVLTVAVVTVVSLSLPALATAASWGATNTDGVVTQTHTLFYNASSCAGNTGYAFTSWNTRWVRTAGGNREIDHANWQTAIDGANCSGGGSPGGFSSGTMYPKFGASNDITWTLQLNWQTTVPIWVGAGSAAKVYLTASGGGPVISTICSNVNIKNNYNGCPVI